MSFQNCLRMSSYPVMNDRPTKDQILIIATAVALLLATIAIINFARKDLIADAIFIIAGLAMIIFRKPFARADVNSDNRMWGTSYGEKDIEQTARSIVLLGLIVIIGGMIALSNVSFGVSISESNEMRIGGVFAIAIGVAAILLRDKDKHSIMHFNGKPAMIRIGKWRIYVHHALAVTFGIIGIFAGLNLLLN